jgi:hypothetical protein
MNNSSSSVGDFGPKDMVTTTELPSLCGCVRRLTTASASALWEKCRCLDKISWRIALTLARTYLHYLTARPTQGGEELAFAVGEALFLEPASYWIF